MRLRADGQTAGRHDALHTEDVIALAVVARYPRIRRSGTDSPVQRLRLGRRVPREVDPTRKDGSRPAAADQGNSLCRLSVSIRVYFKPHLTERPGRTPAKAMHAPALAQQVAPQVIAPVSRLKAMGDERQDDAQHEERDVAHPARMTLGRRERCPETTASVQRRHQCAVVATAGAARPRRPPDASRHRRCGGAGIDGARAGNRDRVDLSSGTSATMVRMRATARAIGAGYAATWSLLRQAWRRPFGTASASHRLWLLPQLAVAGGAAAMIGAASAGAQRDRVVALLVGVALLGAGLALTAVVGRAAHRGQFGEDSGKR